ncbi:MAG TPA: phage holin family protein [Burkholderiaceae bacterium]|nr:phage holin family protein [Burkholderiaceae bacterium]
MDIARDSAGRGGAVPPASAVQGNGSSPARASSSEPTFTAAARTDARPRSVSRPSESQPTRATLSQFINEVRTAFSARFHLFELEAKRAAWSAAYMLAFATAAALLGVTGWLILIGALIYGAVTAGVPWIVAAIVAIGLHAVGAFLLVRAIRSMVDNLTFAATRRTLEKADSAEAPDGRRA